VIHEDATRSPDGGSAPPAERIDTFEAAIATVAARTRALSSAISEVAFADAARLRDELGLAISDAEALAARLPEGMKRVAALHKLGAMRGVANDLRQISPAPSAAAIAAMAAGDPALWSREEEAWIADRLARGSNPQLPTLRRERRATRPDRPWALRAASGARLDAADAACGTTPTASSPPAPEADRNADDRH
jgi:hypothetical protein